MGQQTFEREIIRALRSRLGPSKAFEVAETSGLRSGVSGTRRYSSRLNETLPYQPSRLLGYATYRTASAIVHRLDLRLPPPVGPDILSVHDLAPLRFSDEGVLPASAARSLQRARRVVVLSEFTASELTGLFGVPRERIVVVPCGLAPSFVESARKSSDPWLLNSLGVTSERVVIHAGGATTRKNLANLARAWAALSAEFPDVGLCLVGPHDARRDALFHDVPRVWRLGHQPDDVVPRLMACSAAVVVPSTYEGFGLPALEGMFCGVPVVAAAAGSLPEVCRDGALLVEPDGPGIARGLREVLLPASTTAARLRVAGPKRAAAFTWSAAADRYLKVYATEGFAVPPRLREMI
jgi:glycosyltransferase involved in cell wall biosynthesis